MNLKVNKKFFSLVLAGVIGISGLGFKNRAEAETESYIKTTSQVNVRSDNSTDRSAIGRLSKGTILETTGRTSNGWYEINYDGRKAYVNGDYVSVFMIDNEAPRPLVVRATESVRVRADSNTESEILGVIGKGDALDYVQTVSNGWHQVEYDGRVGYVSPDYSYVDLEGLHLWIAPAVMATTDVKIRANATTDSEQLGILREGQKLRYTKKLDNGWYEVTANGLYGYVNGEYVKEDLIEVDNDNEITKVVYMTEDSVIYYDREFTTPIATIPKNEVGHVYSGGEDYYLIDSERGKGYIKRNSARSLGDVAVVVDISSQLVTLYVDSKPVLTSPIVTGKKSTPTDLGLFEVNAKVREWDMKKYNVHVAYWMPFNGDQGLHDASWRDKFGGDLYTNHGSHGCVNLPYDTAQTIYNNVSVGSKVLVKR